MLASSVLPSHTCEVNIMQKQWQLALLGLALLAVATGVQAAESDEQASSSFVCSVQEGQTVGMEIPQASAQTCYLCQKCYSGCWTTVYVCDCYQDAMNWYNQQPNNARII